MAGGRPTHFDGDLRAALLDAAAEEVREKAPAQLSMRSIARRAGVSHAAPAYHFPDRAALLTALACQGFQTLHAQLTAAMRSTDDPVDRIRATGDAYVQFAEDHPGLFDVMMRRELLRPDDPELLAAQQAAFAALTQTITEAAAHGWGRGTDIDTLALTCWAIVHGLAVLLRSGQLTDLATSPRAVTAALTRLANPKANGQT